MLNCLRFRRKHTINGTSNKFKYLLVRNESQFHSIASNRYQKAKLRLARNAHNGPKVNFSQTATITSQQLTNALPGSHERSKYESNALPRKAKVVICGGGVMGASVAYHLASKNLGNEVILLEQER